MPTALTVLRAALEVKLDDALNVFWTEAELDQHITDALRDLSHYLPFERISTLSTISGNRDLDVSTLAPRIRIVAIEHPTGSWPRNLVPFTVWFDTLTFLDNEPDGGDAKLYWLGHHIITVGNETLSEDSDETLLFGAAARACDQQQADVTNQVTTGGKGTVRDWGSLARHFRREYEKRRDPRQGVQQGRFFVTGTPLPSQRTDPGP